MSVIKAILIEDPSISKTMTMFPDNHCTYWDVSIREKTGVYWYYQMHMTSIVDLLYRAGQKGQKVKIRYQGGAKDVEL